MLLNSGAETVGCDKTMSDIGRRPRPGLLECQCLNGQVTVVLHGFNPRSHDSSCMVSTKSFDPIR